MLDLIQRLETATGQDRKLDEAILKEVLGFRDIHGDGSLFDRGNEGYWSLDGDEKNPPLPSPTASVDGAMLLIPHGAGWNVGGNTSVFYGMVKNCPGKGRSAALALSSAALRARIS